MEAQLNRVYSNCNGYEDKSNFNSSNSSEVKAFQDWLDTAHPIWYKGGKLNKGSGYGSFGPSTQPAYATYGAEYEKKSPGKTGGEPKPKADALEPKADDSKPVDDTTKQSFVDKFKALSTTKKVIVIAIPVIAIGVAIFLIRRKK
jgi:hypothetical protein